MGDRSPMLKKKSRAVISQMSECCWRDCVQSMAMLESQSGGAPLASSQSAALISAVA